MIKSIIKIQNYRIFQAWESEAEAKEFRKINLIYGVNGSGKSTLASIFANAKFDTNWDSGLSLGVENKLNQYEKITTHDHEFWKDIRIFDRNYIKENLQFDSNGSSYAQPLVRVGKENIVRDDRIEFLKLKGIEIEQEIPKIQESVGKSAKGLEKLTRDTADIISLELAVLGGRYERRSYNALQVKQLLDQVLIGVDDDVINESLEMINSPKFTVQKISDAKYLSTLGVMKRSLEIVSRTATSVVIKDLKDNPEKGDWVQKGLDLNRANDACSFCGNTISEERITHLGKHFSASFEELQFDIENTLIEAESLKSKLESIIELVPKLADILPEVRNLYKIELDILSESFNKFLEYLNLLKENLELKKLKLFDSLELPMRLRTEVVVDFERIFQIVQKHNELIKSFEKSIGERATQIEHTRILAIQEGYKDVSSSMQRENTKLEFLQKESEDIQLELLHLNLDGNDPISLASEMNAELAQLLGRDELVFTYIKEGRYSIERSGEPALFLSEGEKSVISLIYFLKSLDAADCDRTNTVVLIDDPISSLDSNFTVALSSYIWSGLVTPNGERDKCKQLFLLTHSFELFRSWCNQLGNEPNVRGKYLVLEIRTRIISDPEGKFLRKPFFLEWPEGLGKKRLKSEYHFLFWRVAEALTKYHEEQSIENELEAAAILPNACRRLLEGFLSFKFPSYVGDFYNLLKSATDEVKDKPTRIRLYTFLNEYSHYAEGDTSRSIMRPEAIGILKAVFELMNEVDPDHCRKMCEALEIDFALVS